MYAVLANVTTADEYTDSAKLRLPGTVRIVLQVANAAVLFQLDESSDGKDVWTTERFLSPSIGSLDRRCSGIRFRSAVAGQPAQVSCELADEDELAGGADSLGAFTSTVSAAGAVDQRVPAEELAYQEFTATVAISAGAEASANTIVTAPEVTVSGSQRILIEFFAPHAERTGGGAETLTFVLYENGASIGRLAIFDATSPKPVAAERRLTPAAGARTYSIRAFRGANNCEVDAGLGGSGNLVPGFIRVTAI